MLSNQKIKKTFTLKYLASLTKSTLVGDADHCVNGVESLNSSDNSKIAFLSDNRYRSLLSSCSAGAVFVHNSFKITDSKNYLLSDNPSKAIQKVLSLFHTTQKVTPGIHPNACISKNATVSDSATIAAGCIIEDGVQIADGVVIMANVTIGHDTQIGKDSLIHPSVVIQKNSTIGKRVIIQSGAIIGSCGYGYFTDNLANHEKIEHFGNVIVEDDVEIGANTTIDRARISSTIIGRGTKIDNLVQIAHNVILGQSNLIVSQTGISGSTSTGNRVILGGQSGIVGHIHITDDVILAAKGGFSKSIKKKGIYSGAPAQPLSQYNKNTVQLRGIEKSINLIRHLEEKVSQLEKKLALLEKTAISN